MTCPYCNKREIGELCNKSNFGYTHNIKRAKSCGSKECKKSNKKRYHREFMIKWRDTKKGKEYTRKYNNSLSGIESIKKYRLSEKAKLNRKEYWQRSYVKKKDKLRYQTIGQGFRKKKIWDVLFRRQSGVDPICGIKIPIWEKRTNEFHIDHIFPSSKGGTSDINNLQILCKCCNINKRSNLKYLVKDQWRLSL